MSGRDEGILHLLALPALGSEMLAPRPSLVFSADGRRILFGNPAGAAFFGASSLAALRERRFSDALPATGQIARAARSLAPGASRLERIRFSGGPGFAGIAAECRRIALPAGEPALMVRLPAPHIVPAEEEAARRLVAFLAGEGRSVAVIDADGRVVAEGPGSRLRQAGERLAIAAAAAAALSGPAHRMLMIAGRPHPATLLVLGSDAAAPVLLLLDDTPSLDRPVAIEPAVPEAAAPAVVAEPVTAPEAVEIESPPEAAVPAEVETAQDEPSRQDEASQSREEPAVSPAAEDSVNTAAEPVALTETPPENQPEAGTDAGDKQSAEPGPSEDSAEGASAFSFVAPTAPVRFVFQMDGDGRFTFISPNFAEWIGPSAAIVVGELWSELAARLALDPSGTVAKLIARRDTWSGVTLDWPVEGSDRFVAVDLAALPAFSRDRHFEGYRGFGVIRASERRRPQESAPAAKPGSAASKLAPRIAERPANGNVIRLPLPHADAERLSPPEQDAFRRIAAALTNPSDARALIAETEVAPSPVAAEPVDERPAFAGEKPVDLPSAEPGAAISDARHEPVAAEEEAEPMPPVVDIPEPVETPDASFAPEAAEPSSAPGADAEIEAQAEAQAQAAAEAKAEEDRARAAEAARVAEEEARAAEEARTAALAAVAADLAASRQRIVELEAILDTATDGVLVLDEEGNIERLNRSAEALFSVDAAGVVGMSITELLAEESRQSALDYLDGLTRNGVASVLNDGREVIGRVPQGGLIPLFMTMGRLPETGKFCAVLRDITQWKNAEGELVSAKRAAENASMQKSDFLAKVSHEIRTPLNAIIGFSEVMMEERFGPIGTERYKEYLRDIHISGAHLMSLLNDLLDLSKIEAGKLDLNFESVALNDIVMECVALMQPQANRERIIIRTSLSGQVPNVVADPRSIRQIVLNLVSNAVKFTLAGGQVIVSTAMEPHGEVTLRIRDTGIGMSSSDIETALKPFRQLSASRERRSDGTGLGLPLTKALVEANRAAFAIDSAVGQGTLIRITFPSTRVLAG